MSEKKNNDEPNVSLTIDICLPNFYSKNPERWFYEVETIFQDANITNDYTKFKYIIDSYDQKETYTIKEIIITMEVKGLGYLRPSLYLKKLCSELKYLEDDQIILVWQSRLPEKIRNIFKTCQELTMDELLGEVKNFEQSRNDLRSLIQNMRSPITKTKSVRIELCNRKNKILRRDWWSGIKGDAEKWINYVGRMMIMLHHSRQLIKYGYVSQGIKLPGYFSKVRCKIVIIS